MLPPAARTRRDLFISRSLYFFFYGGMGIFFTFINVYYRSIGLTGTQIGLVNTIAPLVGFFSTPLWGLLSDRFGKTRLLFSAAASGVILSVLALSRVSLMIYILPVVAIYALFNSPIIPLLDSTTLRLLGEHRERYGLSRVWGTVGFILTSATSGLVLERTGLQAIFPGYALSMIFFLGFSLGLSNQPVRPNVARMTGVGRMLRQPAWVIFAGSVFLLWIAATGAMNFVSVTIKALGGSDAIIGWTWSVAAIFELPVMLVSVPLLRRLGPPRLMAIAMLGYTLRLALYSWMPTPASALAINVLHAFSYVPFWIGAVAYANELASDDLKATAQGVLFSVMNLGSVVGSLLAGWLFDRYGSQGLFIRLAAVCVVALALFVLGRWRLSKSLTIRAGIEIS